MNGPCWRFTIDDEDEGSGILSLQFKAEGIVVEIDGCCSMNFVPATTRPPTITNSGRKLYNKSLMEEEASEEAFIMAGSTNTKSAAKPTSIFPIKQVNAMHKYESQ